jgi:hypothetical protein
MGILDAGLMVSLLKHGWQENRNDDWYTVKVRMVNARTPTARYH